MMLIKAGAVFMKATLPSVIETSRLLLRSYREDDSSWYFEMSQRNQAHLKRYESENPIMAIHTIEDARQMINNFVEAWKNETHFFMGAFLKETDQFVAQVYMGPVNQDFPEFEIGYVADVNHEGHGYVTEAVKAVTKIVFEKLDAHRIRIEMDDTNTRSIGVAERCGFIREGHIRENKRATDGTYSGTLHYGLLQSEFSAEV